MGISYTQFTFDMDLNNYVKNKIYTTIEIPRFSNSWMNNYDFISNWLELLTNFYVMMINL